MRKIWFLMVLILAAFTMLFITACGDDDIDITDPSQAEWILEFFQIPTVETRASFMFEAYWNGTGSQIAVGDTFALTVGGVNIPVEAYSYNNEWFVSAYDFQLDPGTIYAMTFSKNGTQIVSKNIKTCYAVTSDMPASYDPTQSVTLNWTLANNNHTQFVTVAATQWNEGPNSYDEEVYQVSQAARSYTIPANAVQDLGVGTEYELSIMEHNNFFAGTTYIFTNQGAGAIYDSKIKNLKYRIENAQKQAL